MAPPTSYKNTDSASYSKIDLKSTNPDTSVTNKNTVEVGIVKAMLKRDIADFNSHTTSNISDTYRNLINGDNFNTEMRKHIMVNQQENCLGTVFALATEHNNEQVNFINTPKEFDNDNFTADTGKVSLSGEAAPYYDATLFFDVDQAENTFYDANIDNNNDSSSQAANRYNNLNDSKYKVVFSGSENKAANSIHTTTDGKILLASLNIMFLTMLMLYSLKKLLLKILLLKLTLLVMII